VGKGIVKMIKEYAIKHALERGGCGYSIKQFIVDLNGNVTSTNWGKEVTFYGNILED